MVEVWAKENKVIVVRKKVVMIDFMGAKIIHTSCDDTEGDDRGADDTTRCDDKLRLMTNKFNDRFAERHPRSGHPERSSRRVIPQGHPAGSSTEWSSLEECHSRSGHHNVLCHDFNFLINA